MRPSAPGFAISQVYTPLVTLRARSQMFYGRHMAEQQEQDRAFVPRGAIAFFAAMLVFFSLVWLFFYVLLIRRH